jgi:putative peptidoglycan lipid II flippase
MPDSQEHVNDGTPRRGLLAAVMTVGVITFLSRILGLVRDILIARMLGAGIGADAFFVAFRIPNFLRRLFAEGAFSQAFVPVLSEYKTQRSADEVRDLIAHTAGALTLVLTIVTCLGILAAPWVIGVFAPGFHSGDGTKRLLAEQMLRITFPYLLLISLAALCAGVLNTYERFGVPAFTPVFLNVSMIGCALVLGPELTEPAFALAIGVTIGGILQLGFQLPFIARLGLLVWPKIRRGHGGVKRITALMLPALFGASVSQLNLLVNTLLASFLVTGSVSWLYFSDRLLEFPLGVFGVALGTVILPRLSSQHASADKRAFAATLDWSLRLALLIGVPAAVALFVLAGPLLTTLFHYGEFRALDVRMAALSLQAYAFGLVGFVAIKVLAPTYFARQDTRTPVKFGIVAVVANIVFALLLIGPLAHVGLALAISMAGLVNAGLLYGGVIRMHIYQPASGWMRLGLQIAVASLLMASMLDWAAGDLRSWLDNDVFGRIAKLALLVGVGAASYVVTLLALGIRPRQLRAPPSRVSTDGQSSSTGSSE